MSDRTAFISGDVLSNRTEQGASWFKYGTTAAYGQETQHGVVDFEAGVRQGRFALLSGLAHHTTYHYALCAEDQDPSVDALCSGDQTFTTRGDDIRGPLLVLLDSQIITFQFNDVESGYHGEDPRGSVNQTGVFGPDPVVCMRVAGQKFTVGIEQLGGASYALVFADLSPGVNRAAGELVTTLTGHVPGRPLARRADVSRWPRARLLHQRRGLAERRAQEAVPSQVCGLRSQHQPSFGLPSLIQNAGTRWSPRREPAIEKPRLGAMTSGCWRTNATPSSRVRGDRWVSRMFAQRILGPDVAQLGAEVHVDGEVRRRVRKLDGVDRDECLEVAERHMSKDDRPSMAFDVCGRRRDRGDIPGQRQHRIARPAPEAWRLPGWSARSPRRRRCHGPRAPVPARRRSSSPCAVAAV